MVQFNGVEFEVFQAEMKRAFALVENKEHWKGAVDALVTQEAVAEVGGLLRVCEAVEFFTATQATVTVEGGLLRVRAAGYWAGPAN